MRPLIRCRDIGSIVCFFLVFSSPLLALSHIQLLENQIKTWSVTQLTPIYPTLTSKDVTVKIINDHMLQFKDKKITKSTAHLNPKNSILGRRSVTVLFVDDQDHEHRRTVIIDVSASTWFLYMTKSIERHHRIKPADVELRYSKIFGNTKNGVHLSKYIKGKETKHRVSKGAQLKPWMIQAVPDIRKNDKLIIKVESQRINITLDGIALEDGSIGDIIQVKGTKYGKILDGNIVSSKNVTVVHLD